MQLNEKRTVYLKKKIVLAILSVKLFSFYFSNEIFQIVSGTIFCCVPQLAPR